MAILNFTGFETGNSVEAITGAGTIAYSTTTVRTGTYALRVNPTTTGTGSFRLGGLPATGISAAGSISKATIYATFYFRIATLPAATDEEMFKTQDTASTDKFYLRINSAGNLASYDSTNTIIATGSTVLSTGTWYRMEIQVGTGAAATYEVKIDGVSELTSALVNLGLTNNGSIFLGKSTNRNGQSVDFFYDDCAIDDATYLGAGQMTLLVPNATGTYQNWTIGAGAGSNYQNVDEVPHNSDTDYLLSPASGTLSETEAMTDTATVSITGTINSVKGLIVCKRNAASDNIQLRFRSTSTDVDTTAVLDTNAYREYAAVKNTDPATSSAWTTGGVDGIEVGCVAASTTNLVRMTATYGSVYYVPAAGGTTVRQLAALGVG